ncbi:hypothetical protein [Jannaschia sp. LMIT008]|uniref:hypothetical protein n=1 Tax=Jannaschia maritima TaxID=3032585 RepID=UPI0028116D0A|nr:hypothetical protein [Jannaschia sp. LMIT008]
MTKAEQSLADDKMRAEIANLAAQTARIQQQMRWQMPMWMIGFIGAIVAIVNVYGN